MISNLREQLAKFMKGEAGPTAVEYAVMLALIIAVCIAAIGHLGQIIGGVEPISKTASP